MDLHCWRECPMLTQCWECENVIEIQSIEEHLLQDCPQSHKYKFCQKCMTVYLQEEFDDHDCQPTNPKGAVKCPLCSDTIFPNTRSGWINHLMRDRCPGNPRLPKD
mmetsp:Transcript_11417/g.19279  ORF Transcript_11417/g.19279 Transcript_11417/m.19279 type:complete len:106 (+) Transcript_11417:2403-2720(+)